MIGVAGWILRRPPRLTAHPCFRPRRYWWSQRVGMRPAVDPLAEVLTVGVAWWLCGWRGYVIRRYWQCKRIVSRNMCQWTSVVELLAVQTQSQVYRICGSSAKTGAASSSRRRCCRWLMCRGTVKIIRNVITVKAYSFYWQCRRRSLRITTRWRRYSRL